MVICTPVAPVPAAEADLFAPAAQNDAAPKVVPFDPRFEEIEAFLLSLPNQAPYELRHSFAPGIYIREITMYPPTKLIGAEHTGEHFNIVLCGKAVVHMEGKTELIQGPCYFKSGVGVRKVLHILETMRWLTIHPNPTDERDVDKITASLMRESPVYKKFKELMATDRFREHAKEFHPRHEEILP